MLTSCPGAAAWEGLILDNLQQHNEVDNPLWSPGISQGFFQPAGARNQAQPQAAAFAGSPKLISIQTALGWGCHRQLALVWEETSGAY